MESKRYIPEKRRGKVRQTASWKRGRCTLHCKDPHVVSTAATKTTIPGENYHAVWQVHSQLSIPLLHVPKRDTHRTAYIASYTLTIHCEQDVIASTIVNVLLLYPAEHTHGRRGYQTVINSGQLTWYSLKAKLSNAGTCFCSDTHTILSSWIQVGNRKYWFSLHNRHWALIGGVHITRWAISF